MTRFGSYAAHPTVTAADQKVVAYRPLHAEPIDVPVILAHGGIGDAWSFNGEAELRIPRACAAVGLTCLSADLGGNFTFNNPAFYDALEDVIAHGSTTWGLRADKVLLAGISMGAGGVLRWGWANPTKVVGVVTGLAPVDLIGIHDGNLVGMAAHIETAYGGLVGWTAAKASVDPLTNAKKCAPFAATTTMFYGTEDTLCRPEPAAKFAATAGCAGVPLAQGHTVPASLTTRMGSALALLADPASRA